MKEKSFEPKQIVSKIGGQAVLEGVMMRGERAQAMCVRAESGEKLMTSERLVPHKKISRIPILRGVVNFFFMLVLGIRVLMKSADAFGTDEEEMPKGWLWLSVILGILLAVAIFFFVPSLSSDALFKAVGLSEGMAYSLYKALFEGGLRLILFVGYLLLTSLMKDIRRTFMYHGAEHKTINCYEKGLPLTVENVMGCPKVHNRCGTTFLFLVMAVSIVIFALANFLTVGVFQWESKWWINLLVRLVLLPFVAGLSYEALKLLARLPENWLSKIIRAPGLSLQAITTKEPTEEMAECAIAAFLEVQKLDADPNYPTVDYAFLPYTEARARVEETLQASDSVEECDLDWIWCEVLEKERGELAAIAEVKRVQFNRAMGIAKKRADGIPLSYCLKSAYFYGDKLKVTPAVLIPRPETELVAEQAVKVLLEKENPRALDLCTGSGCIAYVLAKYGKASVTATDISPEALRIARQNCAGLDVAFLESDCFLSIGNAVFDVIVSNPPYIPTADLAGLSVEVKKEPVAALNGGEDGLVFYREIAEKCDRYLAADGTLILELGIGQADAVKDMLKDWTVKVLPDYNGIDRILIASRNGL